MVGLSVLFAACSQAVDSGPLADVIRKAETAQLNVTDPPASYVRTGNAEAVRQPLLDGAQASLARDYADPALAQEVAVARAGINGMLDQKGGGRVGGVTSLEISAVQINADHASARARVTVWFKSAQSWWQDPHTRPSANNIIDLDLHFVRRDGAWRIDQESWQFAPGGGP
jgi:hypothetical protein